MLKLFKKTSNSFKHFYLFFLYVCKDVFCLSFHVPRVARKYVEIKDLRSLFFRPFFASSRSLIREALDNPVGSGSVNPGFSILEKVIVLLIDLTVCSSVLCFLSFQNLY
jgi:hypothetical protein